MRNFGEDYSMENIRRRILAQRRPQREHRPEPFRCRLRGDLKQAKKVTGFRALYFHYCYLLGVFPQKQNRPPRRVPHTLREDLIRAQELTDEARLLSRHLFSLFQIPAEPAPKRLRPVFPLGAALG